MEKEIIQNKIDVSSLSNFDLIKQKNFPLVEMIVDFNNKSILGTAVCEFTILDKQCKSVVLDCKGIVIKSVSLITDHSNFNSESDLKYLVHSNHSLAKSLGTPLEIFLPDKYEDNSITIKYCFTVTSESEGIQWLEKNQTSTKKFPYMFSQCEAILARTVIPCQDTPSAKVFFNKVVITVEEGVTALFSGDLLNKTEVTLDSIDSTNNKYTKFEFTQKVQIPTYLFAIAAGEIGYKKISERCGVYAELPLLDEAAEEFKDSENFIKAAEEYLDYPYIWGVYNILVLPPAFPYGGMENPQITFLHPSLVVGDKSLVPTVAHEIAHSWTGNLVTNKDWNNFWMNEGFTVFLERKIVEITKGEEFALLESDVGYWALKYAIDNIGENHRYSSLYPDLKGEDPDDAFSKVPYEKGFSFLVYIESLLGKNKFRDFLRKYIKKYAYCSISYIEFKELLISELNDDNSFNQEEKEKLLKQIDFNLWVLTPGHLPVVKDYSNNLSNQARKLYEEIKGIKSIEESDLNLVKHSNEYKELDSKAKVVVLNLVLNELKEFDLTTNYEHLTKVTGHNNGDKNPEISYNWFQISLAMKDYRCYTAMMLFLQSNGRMKYIKPVYKEFSKLDNSMCREFFIKNRYLYHPVAGRLIHEMIEKK